MAILRCPAKHIGALMPLLHSNWPAARWYLAERLAKAGYPEAVPVLREAFQKGQRLDADSMILLGDEGIRFVAENLDEFGWGEGIRALAKARATSALPAIRRYARFEAGSYRRKEALKALILLGDAPSVTRFFRDPDPDVARAARRSYAAWVLFRN